MHSGDVMVAAVELNLRHASTFAVPYQLHVVRPCEGAISKLAQEGQGRSSSIVVVGSRSQASIAMRQSDE